MKKTLDIIIVILISISLFVLASAFKAFQINSIVPIASSLLYFLFGLAIQRYYNKREIVLIFFGTTLFLSCGILIMPNMVLYIFLVIISILIVSNLFLGYYFTRLPYVIKYLSILSMVGIIIYTSFDYMPKNIAKRSMTTYSNLYNQPFANFMSNVRLKDTSNNLVENYIQKDSIYLLEFFFKNCAPCRFKEKVLPLIASEFKDKPFKIIFVDNSKLDSFETFTEGANKKMYALNFYDVDNILIKNLEIQSFPFEVILDKKGIIRHSYSGYNFDADSEYLKITTNKIKELLNE